MSMDAAFTDTGRDGDLSERLSDIRFDTSLVLADFVECMSAVPYPPQPCRHRVLDALSLGHHVNLYCGLQNHLRASAL